MKAGATVNQIRRQVLVVDDDAGMRLALEVSFGRRGWQVESASGKADALSRLRLRPPSLVVSDVRMPDGDGFEVMQAAREMARQPAVILLTAFGSVPDAVTAMKSGACEYLLKPVPFERLLKAADRVCAAQPTTNMQLVGSSAALCRALAQARRAAASDADVLIEAESGTGKELLARMIHSLSGRRERPFVAINCAGFPESLLESELFGHGRGAFTGADTAQSGKFQLADDGTLLLDEIGEMPLTLQPKLLRALQEREFYRLGESAPVKVNIRVIATTNRPLAAAVREGRFRSDLYYRLNVIPLTLPPLRERREDIRELVKYFTSQFAGPTEELPETLLKQFEDYDWPGNVRELANMVRRILALRQEGFEAPWGPSPPALDVLTSCDPPQRFFLGCSQRSAGRFEPGLSLDAMQRRLFEMTLDATGGNRSRAAKMLGVSLRTVRNKVREYNLPSRRQYAQGND